MPAELVEVVPGQAVRRKLNPLETSNMITIACRSPVANLTSIASVGRSTLQLDNNPKLVRRIWRYQALFVLTPGRRNSA